MVERPLCGFQVVGLAPLSVVPLNGRASNSAPIALVVISTVRRWWPGSWWIRQVPPVYKEDILSSGRVIGTWRGRAILLMLVYVGRLD